jgi:hypothetical protein
MVERKKFEGKKIFDIITTISRELDAPVTAYLIGGLGMIHYGAKAATKDVDMVFRTKEDLKRFEDVLRKNGYAEPEYLPKVYHGLGTQAMLIGPEGFLFDMFVLVVCGCLEVSEGMRSRSDTMDLEGNLELRVVSPEDIFLFKSITSRPDDLADMATIAGRGLEWDTIESELRGQRNYWKWLTRYFIRLEELEEEFGIVHPKMEKLEEEAEIAAGIGLILTRLEYQSPTEKEAKDLLDEEDEDFSTAVLEKMKELDLIIVKNGRIQMKKKE